MIRRRKLTWIYILFCLPVFGQDISIITNWDYQRKNDRFEKINATVATTHGFIIAVGETTNPSLQDRDGLFILLNAETGAREIWKELGGIGEQSFNSIVQNPNGTFTIVGYNRRDGKQQDGWIVIVDERGEIIDESKINISGEDDVLNDVAINLAGQRIIAGVQNIDKDPAPWVLSLDEELSTITLNPSIPQGATIEGLTADDLHFLMVGNTDQKDKEHPSQIWSQKITVDGSNVWGSTKYFGDRRGIQEASDIRNSPINGGYIISGVTNTSGAGKADMWLIKIDAEGEITWERALGDFAGDVAASVVELGTGGYALFWTYLVLCTQSFKIKF